MAAVVSEGDYGERRLETFSLQMQTVCFRSIHIPYEGVVQPLQFQNS